MPNPTIKEQSCHTFALSGDVSEDHMNTSEEFQILSDELGFRNDFGSDLDPKALQRKREEILETVVAFLYDPVEIPEEGVFLCGGYMKRDLLPSHFWIECRNRKNDMGGIGVTYDTFINVSSVIKVNEVGVVGRDFRPGCEATAFNAKQIVRIPVEGLTAGHLSAIKDAVTMEEYKLLRNMKHYNALINQYGSIQIPKEAFIYNKELCNKEYITRISAKKIDEMILYLLARAISEGKYEDCKKNLHVFEILTKCFINENIEFADGIQKFLIIAINENRFPKSKVIINVLLEALNRVETSYKIELCKMKLQTEIKLIENQENAADVSKNFK